MARNWPVITSICNAIWPNKKPDIVPPPPTPEPPAPVAPPAPEFPEHITPSRVNVINYVRAFMILRAIPFAKLREEFMKLPLKKIAYVSGVFVWLYMTYTFVVYLWHYLTSVSQ